MECRAPSSQEERELTQVWALPQGQKNLTDPRTQAALHLTFFLETAPDHSYPKSSSTIYFSDREGTQQNAGCAAAC